MSTTIENLYSIFKKKKDTDNIIIFAIKRNCYNLVQELLDTILFSTLELHSAINFLMEKNSALDKKTLSIIQDKLKKAEFDEIRPSNLNRKVSCSYSCTEPKRERKESQAAKKGTLLHDKAKKLILLSDEDILNVTNIDPHISTYVGFLRQFKNSRLVNNLFLEKKFKHNGMSGTPDCLIEYRMGKEVKKQKIHILDLKTGSSIVKAENNFQLYGYAYLYSKGNPIKYDFILSIIQGGMIATVTTTEEELTKYFKMIDNLNNPDREYLQTPGDWCTYCTLKLNCHAYKEKYNIPQKTMSAFSLPNHEIEKIIKKGPLPYHRKEFDYTSFPYKKLTWEPEFKKSFKRYKALLEKGEGFSVNSLINKKILKEKGELSLINLETSNKTDFDSPNTIGELLGLKLQYDEAKEVIIERFKRGSRYFIKYVRSEPRTIVKEELINLDDLTLSDLKRLGLLFEKQQIFIEIDRKMTFITEKPKEEKIEPYVE